MSCPSRPAHQAECARACVCIRALVHACVACKRACVCVCVHVRAFMSRRVCLCLLMCACVCTCACVCLGMGAGAVGGGGILLADWPPNVNPFCGCDGLPADCPLFDTGLPTAVREGAAEQVPAVSFDDRRHTQIIGTFISFYFHFGTRRVF